MTGTPLVSIIILNWNGFDDTVRCLDSLRQLTYPDFEVVLVDNGSSDGSAERLPPVLDDLPYPVEFIKSERNTGFAGGNTLGLQRCRGEFIALLNNDTVVDPEWLSALVARMLGEPRIAAVGGPSYFWNDEHPAFDRSNPFYAYQDIDAYSANVYTRMGLESPAYVDNVVACAVLLRRSAITELGFLDQRFFAYYEETDLFARFIRSGYLIAYEPAAVVWHKVAASAGVTSTFRSFHLQRNRALFALRNFDRPYLRVFIRWYLRDESMFLAMYCRRRVKRLPVDELAKARVCAFGSVMANMPRALLKRRVIVRHGRYNEKLSFARDLSVSVIVVGNDASRRTQAAVESARNQSHPVDEVIAVDAGSDDASSAAVRNQVFRASRGRFVLFLDGEDRLRPDAIRRLLDALVAEPLSSFAYADAERGGAEPEVIRSDDFSRRALMSTNLVRGSALVRREALESVGGLQQFPSRYLQDWNLYLSLVEDGHRGIRIPEVLLDRGGGRDCTSPSRAELEVFRSEIGRRHPRLDPWSRLPGVASWRRLVSRPAGRPLCDTNPDTAPPESGGPSDAPRVSVVIPNWNGMQHLPECLAALAAQSFTHYEIILVDNASSDDSVAWVTQNHPGVRIVQRPDNGGFSKAVNAGIVAARGEYVALLNNDTAVAPDWLGALVQALVEHTSYDFAACKMVLYDRPDRLNAAGDVYSLHRLAGKNRGLGRPVRRYARMQRVLGACAGAALYRRSLFATVGLFDEWFFLTAEDTDFNLRCLIAGKRCLYVPTAQVKHKLRATADSGALKDLALLAARNEAFVAARDLPAVLLPCLPLLWAGRILRSTLLVRPSRLRVLPSVARQLPRKTAAEWQGMRAGLKRRQEVWSLRALSTGKVLRWLIKGSGRV